ncbi:hypothetical protein LIER_00184 [Lithospermum erythrorhizon]|uniref:Uncharacterized protein n=1 Tax=Lithospermum erythrorhizon TaxID=34254 RepID=A0AAV3NH96_LITER
MADIYMKPLVFSWHADLQGSKECHSMHCCLSSILVYLPHLQISQGAFEHGGGGKEVQRPVDSSHCAAEISCNLTLVIYFPFDFTLYPIYTWHAQQLVIKPPLICS